MYTRQLRYYFFCKKQCIHVADDNISLVIDNAYTSSMTTTISPVKDIAYGGNASSVRELTMVS